VVGGLSSTLFLTLFTLPAVYRLADRFRSARHRLPEGS